MEVLLNQRKMERTSLCSSKGTKEEDNPVCVPAASGLSQNSCLSDLGKGGRVR